MRWVVFSVAVVAVFTIFVTVFAASANKNEVRTLPKWLWIVLCAVVPVFGGLLYLIIGRPSSSKPPQRKTKTVAPDDDPRFLRDLAERLEREKKPEDDSKPGSARNLSEENSGKTNTDGGSAREGNSGDENPGENPQAETK